MRHPSFGRLSQTRRHSALLVGVGVRVSVGVRVGVLELEGGQAHRAADDLDALVGIECGVAHTAPGEEDRSPAAMLCALPGKVLSPVLTSNSDPLCAVTDSMN